MHPAAPRYVVPGRVPGAPLRRGRSRASEKGMRVFAHSLVPVGHVTIVNAPTHAPAMGTPRTRPRLCFRSAVPDVLTACSQLVVAWDNRIPSRARGSPWPVRDARWEREQRVAVERAYGEWGAEGA